METYDLIIIGTGPAGMNAAVYAGRYKLKTLLIGELPGGMVSETTKICNYLSYDTIDGMELTRKMEKQVKGVGVEVKYNPVVEVSKKENLFEVKSVSETYLGKKIILATGSGKKKLNLEREKELLGKGISYCAVCDAVFFQDKVVGVVGGGNSALKAAILLSEYAKKVYIIYRKDNFFRAEPAWVESVEKNEKIGVIFEANVVQLIGEEKLKSIKLDNGGELEVDGLFIEVGNEPKNELAVQLGVELEGSFIKIDRFRKTNVKGVFAAGDITNGPLKQIITAAADGAIAVTAAYRELKEES